MAVERKNDREKLKESDVVSITQSRERITYDGVNIYDPKQKVRMKQIIKTLLTIILIGVVAIAISLIFKI